MFKAINTSNQVRIKSIEKEKLHLIDLYEKYLKTKTEALDGYTLKNIENGDLLKTIRLFIFYDKIKNKKSFELLELVKKNLNYQTPHVMGLIVEKGLVEENYVQAGVVLRYCISKGIVSGKLIFLECVFKKIRRISPKQDNV